MFFASIFFFVFKEVNICNVSSPMARCLPRLAGATLGLRSRWNSNAKLQRTVESKVKNFGFKKASKRAVLPRVLTLKHRFDPMADNRERILTFYAYTAVKTNGRLLTL
jgi:hypothetical protein